VWIDGWIERYADAHLAGAWTTGRILFSLGQEFLSPRSVPGESEHSRSKIRGPSVTHTTFRSVAYRNTGLSTVLPNSILVKLLILFLKRVTLCDLTHFSVTPLICLQVNINHEPSKHNKVHKFRNSWKFVCGNFVDIWTISLLLGVGIAMGYVLDGRGAIPGKGKIFSSP
jgi:hypothetical protein